MERRNKRDEELNEERKRRYIEGVIRGAQREIREMTDWEVKISWRRNYPKLIRRSNAVWRERKAMKTIEVLKEILRKNMPLEPEEIKEKENGIIIFREVDPVEFQEVLEEVKQHKIEITLETRPQQVIISIDGPEKTWEMSCHS
jgi:Zn/Cd-binding protein ZinT